MKKVSRVAAAMAWKVVALLAFALCNVINRRLSQQIPLVTMIGFQYGIMLLVVAFEFCNREFWQALKEEARLHSLRGLLSCVGVIAWYGSLAHLQVAQAIVLGSLSPLVTAVGAWVWLKEPWDKRLAICVVMALGGGLCVAVTGSTSSGLDKGGWYTFLPLVSSLCFSGATLVTKKLTQTHRPTQLAAASFGSIFPLYFVLSMGSWHGISVETSLVIVGVGLLATTAHLALIQSYRLAPVTQLLPVGALKWVIHAVLGAFMLGEYPASSVIFGAGLIVTSLAYFTVIQSKLTV